MMSASSKNLCCTLLFIRKKDKPEAASYYRFSELCAPNSEYANLTLREYYNDVYVTDTTTLETTINDSVWYFGFLMDFSLLIATIQNAGFIDRFCWINVLLVFLVQFFMTSMVYGTFEGTFMIFYSINVLFILPAVVMIFYFRGKVKKYKARKTQK